MCDYRLQSGWWPHAQILLLNWENGLPQPQLSVLFLTVPGAPIFDDRSESGIIEGKGGRLVATIHVRYEILDDPGRAHPDSAPDSFAWGVQAVGLPGNLRAFGLGDTLAEALDDLSEGVGRWLPRPRW